MRWRGVGACVGSRWQKCHRITPPTQGLPPWASPRLAPGSRPHAYRQAREAAPAVAAGRQIHLAFTWHYRCVFRRFLAFRCATRFLLKPPSEPLQQRLEGGADSRIRTDDQRFTKPLLYH